MNKFFELPARSDAPRRNVVSAALRHGTLSVQEFRDDAERRHEQHDLSMHHASRFTK